MKEEIYARLDGLKELFTEKFEVNQKQHFDIVEQVTKTNGRLRLIEKVVWVGIGGVGFTSLGSVPQALQVLSNLIK